MSTVTDIILICGTSADQDNARRFGEALDLHSVSKGKPLAQVDEHAGGSHAIQADVWMGAYNYLDEEEALKVFYSLVWEDPNEIQLLMKYEDWDRFKVFVPEIKQPFVE